MVNLNAQAADDNEPVAAQALLSCSRATESSSVDRHHNAPTSLSASEDETLEAARAAWVHVKKRTFEAWITIGKGIRILRRRADLIGGRKTFHRLLAEQGFRVDGPKLRASIR